MTPNYPYYWRVKTRLPERFMQPCRIMKNSRGRNMVSRSTVAIEFEDGFIAITSLNYIRKRKVKGK